MLFFVQLETCRITLASVTRHPTADWMVQMSRNATDEESGHLLGQRYLLHDRDTRFCPAFRSVLRSAGVRPVVLPPQSRNLNAFAEPWVRSVKQECLSKLILFGEVALRRALAEYTEPEKVGVGTPANPPAPTRPDEPAAGPGDSAQSATG